jgi:tetratricopeptide (TPR) repeat protein
MQTESTTNVTADEPVAAFTEGVKMLKNDYPKKALACFKRALESDRQNPYYLSFLGVSMARGEKNLTEAVKLCEAAIQKKRGEIQFHLNLADVYASAGLRESALHTLDRALASFGEDKRLRSARSRVEKRRTPVLSFLTSGNFLNRELGKLRHRILQRFDR